MKTAAVLLIGDEILSGKFRDENGQHAIHAFRGAGVRLKCLTVIPDEVEEIAREVRRCKAAYDIVVTSGGVGPTHDDVTLESIARAFEVQLQPHPELRAAVESFGWEITEAVMRMVRVPEGTTLNWLDGLRYPVIQIDNVYVLPGVPAIFKAKFDALLPGWSSTPLVTDRVYATDRESEIAQVLMEIDQRHGGVAIGSYPRFDAKGYRVIITLEGENKADLVAARADIEAQIQTVNLETP